jgi:hypothetical protein
LLYCDHHHFNCYNPHSCFAQLAHGQGVQLRSLFLEDAIWQVSFVVVMVVGLWSEFLGGRITSYLSIPAFICALWRDSPGNLSLAVVILMYILSACQGLALLRLRARGIKSGESGPRE